MAGDEIGRHCPWWNDEQAPIASAWKTQKIVPGQALLSLQLLWYHYLLRLLWISRLRYGVCTMFCAINPTLCRFSILPGFDSWPPLRFKGFYFIHVQSDLGLWYTYLSTISIGIFFAGKLSSLEFRALEGGTWGISEVHAMQFCSSGFGQDLLKLQGTVWIYNIQPLFRTKYLRKVPNTQD